MTATEQAFVNRMIPHVLAGKSFEDAARAVLDDDERIWLASTAKDDIGEFIRRELAAQIFHGIRSQ